MTKPSLDRVRSHVRSLVDELGSGGPFRDDEDVFAAGVLRSIHLLELIVGVEDTYGIVVDQRDVTAGRLRSVDAVVTLVGERATPAGAS